MDTLRTSPDVQDMAAQVRVDTDGQAWAASSFAQESSRNG